MQRPLIFHLGMLAGLTGLIFFGPGLLGLLQGDPGILAVAEGYGPTGRTLALGLLAADTAASLAITAGCLWFRRTPGPWIAAAGLFVIALTLAAGLAEKRPGGIGAEVLNLGLPALICLLLAVGILRQRRVKRGPKPEA